jgi:hypothetical protein
MKIPKKRLDGQNVSVDCDCDQDPIACLKKLFVDVVQNNRIRAGQQPARRPVFLRLHGVARATLMVRPDLPDELRVGIFRGKSYEAWIRFSSDLPVGADFLSTVGIGLKLFGVAGAKVFPEGSCAVTHDFIFQNHDIFFVPNAQEMCKFTHAAVVLGDLDSYLKAHPRTDQILKDMEKIVPSILATDYWAILPFQFGPTHAKYKLTSVTVPGGPIENPNTLDPFYMHKDLRKRLLAGPATMQMLVQLRTDPASMPLDDASSRWDEKQSRFVPVADLQIGQQDVDDRGTATYGENLVFNIWNALPEHRPVGSIAEARRIVYAASAEVRSNVNGIPLGEPVQPRSVASWPQAKDSVVVRARIHPSIGVARVGNSVEFVYAPEVSNPTPAKAGTFHDKQGALKRQACRFRIYGYNAADEVVSELTAGNAEIHWKVHVANKKAAWYRFPMAMDIPEATAVRANRRNKEIKGAARANLVLDAGGVNLAGKNLPAQKLMASGAFGSATFEVCLGEVQTDADGRLVIVAGYGKSASPTGAPVWDGTPAGFPNADGWYDDVCDGPVMADVNIDGKIVPVESAWILTAPPNYAPQILGVRTLYDLLEDLYTRFWSRKIVAPVSFTKDVYPILNRLSRLQWVNAGFAAEFGWSGVHDFGNQDYIAILSSASPTWAEHRRQVLTAFRDPAGKDNNPRPWPWLYGDAMDIPAADTPRQNSSISATQYSILRRWADGDFVADWGTLGIPRDLTEVPLASQPSTLDKASLDFCLADAFHPGAELTWPMRQLSLYAAPFRIRQKPAGSPTADYGDQLTSAIVMQVGGPLYEQGPGDLTRWMGLPWQMDTAMCRSGYEPEFDPFVPSFWPARVPNQVLLETNYKFVINTKNRLEDRIATFMLRDQWTAPLQGDTPLDQMTDMVARFKNMGVVEWRPGAPPFPDNIFVVSQSPASQQEFALKLPIVKLDRVSEAGWQSEAQLQKFRAAARAMADRSGDKE